ncbi:MAG: DUF115 domain-containing protein, partial [Butyrivibrio sp.]|nr:DUF115 domain-containing protein [Butyrivibrio sp.]
MSDDLFAVNMSAIEKFDHNFFLKLSDFVEADCYDIQIDEGKQQTIKVDGIQLTSHHDRMGYAEYRCKNLKLNEPIIIYGFGLGDELEYLLSKKDDFSVYVILLNPSLFCEILHFYDISKYLDARVYFIIPDDTFTYSLNSVVITSELYIKPQNLNNLKMKLINMLDDLCIEHEALDKNRSIFEKNLKANYGLLKTELTLTEDDLKDIKDTVIVIAPGPSLENNVQRLLSITEKNSEISIIAVDTALPAVLHYGIEPDIFVTSDAFI